MIVVCTLDNNFIRHCAAMLHSLREHNRGDDITLYLVHDRLDPLERGRLVSFLGGLFPSVSMIQVDPRLLEGFPVFGHVTVATYFRLLLPAVLPPGIRRVLFIDGDTIITDSLEPLWTTPLQGRPIAAVPEHSQEALRRRLGFGPDTVFFNAGVMLMDMDLWRREDVAARGLAYARDHQERIAHWDQDVLNVLFEGEWVPLHERWNVCPHLYGLNPAVNAAPEALTASEREALADPGIVHYAGGGTVKPWSHRCTHPLRRLYRDHAARTPWADVPLIDRPPPPLQRLWNRSLFRLKCETRKLLPGR